MYRAPPLQPWALPGASLLLPVGSQELFQWEGDRTEPSHTQAHLRGLGTSTGAQLWVRFGESLWLNCEIGKLKIGLCIFVVQEHAQQRQ